MTRLGRVGHTGNSTTPQWLEEPRDGSWPFGARSASQRLDAVNTVPRRVATSGVVNSGTRSARCLCAIDDAT